MSRTGVADGKLEAANVLTVPGYVGSQKSRAAGKKGDGRRVSRGPREGIAPPIGAIDSRSGKIPRLVTSKIAGSDVRQYFAR